MFAPKIAKSQTKSTTSSTNGLVLKRSTRAGYRSVHDPVEPVLSRQRAIGNQARLLAGQTSSLTESERGGNHDKDAASENTTARETLRGTSWEFSKIPLFPPDRANQSRARSSLSARLLLGFIQPKLAVGGVNDPLEHEADRVADEVMRMPYPNIAVSAGTPGVSRKCA